MKSHPSTNSRYIILDFISNNINKNNNNNNNNDDDDEYDNDDVDDDDNLYFIRLLDLILIFAWAL